MGCERSLRSLWDMPISHCLWACFRNQLSADRQKLACATALFCNLRRQRAQQKIKPRHKRMREEFHISFSSSSCPFSDFGRLIFWRGCDYSAYLTGWTKVRGMFFLPGIFCFARREKEFFGAVWFIGTLLAKEKKMREMAVFIPSYPLILSLIFGK